MIEEIGEILKDRISGAVYADRLAGIVSVIQYKDKIDGKEFMHRFPAACDIESLNCGEETNKVNDLVPDSKKKSVIFFEDISGANLQGKDRGNNVYQANVRLVAWINQKQLGKSECSVTGPIMNDLITRLQTTSPINISPYTKMKISVIKIVPKTPAIFNRYTFPLTGKQYLMYPFDYFALDIRVQFNINSKCLDEYVLGTVDECNNN
jgi:hypothetical protein